MENIFIYGNYNKKIQSIKRILTALNCVVILFAVFGVLLLLISLRVFITTSYINFLAVMIGVSVLLMMLINFTAILKMQKLEYFNKSFTYIEIAENEIIISEFDGDCIVFGEHVVYKKMHIIPTDDIIGVMHDRKKSTLLIKTNPDKIRSYRDRAEVLDYTFYRGKLKFDFWYNNEAQFQRSGELLIKNKFGDSGNLCEKIVEIRTNRKEPEKKRPYVHKELPEMRRRRAWQEVNRLLQEKVI